MFVSVVQLHSVTWNLEQSIKQLLFRVWAGSSYLYTYDTYVFRYIYIIMYIYIYILFFPSYAYVFKYNLDIYISLPSMVSRRLLVTSCVCVCWGCAFFAGFRWMWRVDSVDSWMDAIPVWQVVLNHTIHGTGIFTYIYHRNQPFM